MKNTLFIGDSHTFQCFCDGKKDVVYIVDVTLNQIRQFNSDFLFRNEGYLEDELQTKFWLDSSGDSLVEYLNETSHEIIVFSLGEIDIRYHLKKQHLLDNDCIRKISEVYANFLNKINKKIIVCSSPPPGIDNKNEFTRDLEYRKFLTIEFNKHLVEMCKNNNFLYFDLYTDFSKDGFLNYAMSNDNLHISKSYQPIIEQKLINLINESEF